MKSKEFGIQIIFILFILFLSWALLSFSLLEAEAGQVPVAESKTVRVYKNIPKSICLSATDPDGEPLTFNIAAHPQHGKLNLATTNPVPSSGNTYFGLNYTPDKAFLGTDSFIFTATDNIDGVSNQAAINIDAVAPAPAVWLLPFGIPEPEFGIEQTPYMYQGQRLDFNGNGILEPGNIKRRLK
jgi:hypothetical protein